MKNNLTLNEDGQDEDIMKKDKNERNILFYFLLRLT